MSYDHDFSPENPPGGTAPISHADGEAPQVGGPTAITPAVPTAGPSAGLDTPGQGAGPEGVRGGWRRGYVWVIFAVLLLGWPLAALLSAPGDIERVASYVTSARLPVYINTGLMMWLMFLLIWSAQRAGRDSLKNIGFATARTSDPLVALGFLLGANLILNVLAWTLKSAGITVPEQAIQALLPVGSTERFFWVLLSISSGVCEESCFRGFLLTQGSRLTSRRWIPVLASSLAFGAGHLYQGTAGAALIVVYGIMFCWLRLWRQSLWPGIWAHIWQNLGAMVFGQWAGY